jgi:23S rRNA-/tRNA-specific pseudouridylate synthase
MGYPVVGDEQHGAEGNPIGRIALHASALELLILKQMNLSDLMLQSHSAPSDKQGLKNP